MKIITLPSEFTIVRINIFSSVIFGGPNWQLVNYHFPKSLTTSQLKDISQQIKRNKV